MEYVAAKSLLRGTAALATFLRGKRERKARRALGLIDDRWPRLYARLRLCEIGRRDDASALSRLPHDIVLLVVEFLMLAPEDMEVAKRRIAAAVVH